jgi:hypothetical protein
VRCPSVTSIRVSAIGVGTNIRQQHDGNPLSLVAIHPSHQRL